MPQIAQIGEIYASQLFWLAIVFALVLVTVGYGMLPKIQSTIDARDGQIAADLAKAEEARTRADTLEEEYRISIDRSRADAARVAGEAKDNAARLTEAALAKADKAIETKTAKALDKIVAARTEAAREIEAVAAEAVVDITRRVAGLDVDGSLAKAAVAKEMTNA